MNSTQVVQQMTLDEKVRLGSGKDFWHTKCFKQYGIESIMMSDGPHGLRKQPEHGSRHDIHHAIPSTCFPTAATTACSWDITLLQQVGQAIAKEAAAQNVSVLLGPGLNMKRNPLNGRNFEYYSEDPYLSGHMAAGFIRGVQSGGIAACPKHFAANNQEYMRFSSDSVMDDRTLREIYLKGFEIAVKQSNPKTIMTSYNKINGVYSSQNQWLLQDILRQEWGFDGLVMTDWGGMNDRIKGYKAGCDLVMPGGSGYMEQDVIKAVETGKLDEDTIDCCAGRVVQLVDRVNSSKSRPEVPFDDHHELALQAALGSAVLLKNDDQLLPLRKDQSICLIGHMAQHPRYQGAGSSYINPTRLTNVVDELPHAGYARGTYQDGSTDDGLIVEAKKLAAAHDIAVVVVGLPPNYESEGFDRSDMKMPSGHDELITQVVKANPNTAVVLLAGSPVETPWIDKVKGLLYMALPGQAGGQAIPQLLYGQVNPSGKLSETWPIKYHDVPSATFYSHSRKDGEYREGIYVGYRYYDKARVPVRFPFGFGLSYTQFEYSRLQLSGNRLSFDLTNTGTVAGSEIVQLYVAAPQDGIHRPVKELKRFDKITLEAGECKTVEFELRSDCYAIWHDNGWRVPAGEYRIMIASDSETVRLITVLSVEGDIIEPAPWQAGSWYETLSGDVTADEWSKLLGYRYHAPIVQKGRFDMSHSIGEMKDHSRLMKVADWGLKKYIGRGFTDKDDPVYHMMIASSVESTLSNLQITGGIPGGVIKRALQVANGEYMKRIKQLIK